VSNLEKQIAEMNRKIDDAEKVIQESQKPHKVN